MKTTLTTLILSLSLSVYAQEYRVPIPNSNLHWKFSSLDDNKRVGILVGDTLFVNKEIKPFTDIKEQINTTRSVTYNNRSYVFKVFVFDKAYVYSKKKKGLSIW